MRANKRSRVDIYYTVLDLLCQEGAKEGMASPTRVARRANLPYDRFQTIIDDFLKAEMVNKTAKGLKITEKGVKCLCQLHQTNSLLRRMGLST